MRSDAPAETGKKTGGGLVGLAEVRAPNKNCTWSHGHPELCDGGPVAHLLWASVISQIGGRREPNGRGRLPGIQKHKNWQQKDHID